MDDETRELAIAVRREARGAELGTRLLQRLLERADRSYSRSVSLSVRADNPALNLYERMGFRVVEGSQRANRVGGTSITMKRDLHG